MPAPIAGVPPDATPAPPPVPPLPAPTACGVLGDACTGSCVETARGALCFPACQGDAECRPKDGVFCDPQWHACMIPNYAAIVPRQCPTPAARDTAFAASVAWSIDKPAGAYQNAPSAVLTADGGTTAVFATRGRLGETALQVVHVDGKGQRSEGVGPTTVQRADEAHLARDRKGTLYAAWHGGDAETDQIGFATSGDGGVSWSTPARVNEPGDCAGEPCLGSPLVLVGGAHETIYVAYGAGDAGLRVRASKDAGATWSSPVTALVGTVGSGAVGSDGTLHLAMLNGSAHGAFGSAQHAIEYTASTDGAATFKPPVVVSGRDELLPFYFARPAVAVDTRRKLVYVVYVRGGRDAVWDLVLAMSKDGGVKWSRQTLAGGGCAIHMVPTLALDDVTGNLHVAYYDNEGTIGRFVHARCAPGATRCQVLGAINSEPFAALATGRESATWLGESAALLVDGKRKTLRAVWTQPVGDPAIARIQFADGKLK